MHQQGCASQLAGETPISKGESAKEPISFVKLLGEQLGVAREAFSMLSQADGHATKITLRIPADSAKRFGVHAEMAGQSKRHLFLEMIDVCCRRDAVHERGKAQSPTPGEPV